MTTSHNQSYLIEPGYEFWIFQTNVAWGSFDTVPESGEAKVSMAINWPMASRRIPGGTVTWESGFDREGKYGLREIFFEGNEYQNMQRFIGLAIP